MFCEGIEFANKSEKKVLNNNSEFIVCNLLISIRKHMYQYWRKQQPRSVLIFCGKYHIYRKNLDTQKNGVIILKFYCIVMGPKDADKMTNSVDPDQTESSLIWVYTVCPCLSVWKLRIIMVMTQPGASTSLQHHEKRTRLGRLFLLYHLVWALRSVMSNVILYGCAASPRLLK